MELSGPAQQPDDTGHRFPCVNIDPLQVHSPSRCPTRMTSSQKRTPVGTRGADLWKSVAL